MKKSIVTILALAAVMLPVTVQAKTIGTVLSTDIGTVIDGAACKTYNVDGRTFVVAEDLQGYGFDVDYNNSARRLTVTQNPYSHRALLTADEVNIEKKNCPVGNRVMDILSSDITVTVEGETVEGYNIDGRMVIPVRALEPCAYVEYDNDKRLVTVRGLKHYLDDRYNAGNPNVTREVKEYSQPVHTWGKTLGGHLAIDDEYDTDVKEITTSDSENGKMYSYYGNPLNIFAPTPLDHMEKCYDREIYSIAGADGEWLYEADLLYRQDTGFRYIITSDRAQKIGEGSDMLYGYKVFTESNHANAWPEVDGDISNVKFEKFTSRGAVTENGCLYTIEDLQKENCQFARYNIADVIYHKGDFYLLSRDNVLFKADSYYGNYGKQEFYSNSTANQKASSAFDSLVAYNIKKMAANNSSLYCLLNTDGELYYNDTILASDIKDVIAVGDRSLCVLTNGGEVYFGSYDDFANNQQRKMAENIKKIYSDVFWYKYFYYINSNDELYKYYKHSAFGDQYEKLEDNISHLISSNMYITTDNRLIGPDKEYAEDVKDAYYDERYEVTYIIKTDGTLWYYKDGELARVKAFE